MRRVVCEANKYSEKVFIMRDCNIPAIRRIYGEVQGFVDQYGVFMDRKEAMIVAREANQIVRLCGNPDSDELFSENLY